MLVQNLSSLTLEATVKTKTSHAAMSLLIISHNPQLDNRGKSCDIRSKGALTSLSATLCKSANEERDVDAREPDLIP